MESYLTGDPLKITIVKSCHFLKEVLNEECIKDLCNDESSGERQEKIYRSIIFNLSLPQIYVLSELLARLTLYIDAETIALEKDKSPMYAKTKTDLDYTLKLLWKEQIKPVIEKKIQSKKNEDDTDDEDNEIDSETFFEFFQSISELVQVINSKLQ